MFTKNFGLISVMPTDFISTDFNMFVFLLLIFLLNWIIFINHEIIDGFFRSYTDNANTVSEYNSRSSLAPQNFTSLISNEEVQDMFHSSDNATQLRAAFLLSLRQIKVSFLYYSFLGDTN